MRIPTRRCSAVLVILTLFLSPAVLSATPLRRTEPSRVESGGLLAFAQNVLSVFWGENGNIFDPN